MEAVMTNVNIPIEKTLKERADEFFDEVGLDFPTAVGVFIRQTLREGRIPFRITVDRPNEETIAALLEGERLAYDSTAKGYKNLDELFEELKRDEA